MSGSAEVDIELDIKGLLCPLPLVRLSKAIDAVPVGGVLRAVSDDPTCMADIPAWAKSTGHELVTAEHDGRDYVFVIRRVE